MNSLPTILNYIRLGSGNHLLITGNSGSGKTRLCRTIASAPELSGRAEFVSQHYHFTNRAHVNQLYYQQRFNSMDADDSATVQEELDSLGVSSSDIHQMLLLFGMGSRQFSPLLHLSSGEHKRFQLIRAFLQLPQILILDEPFTGMDTRSRTLLQQKMTEMSGKCQFIIICSEADCPEFITQMLFLDEGSILFSGPVSDGRILHTQAASGFHINLPANSAPLTELPPTLIELRNATVQYGGKIIFENLSWTVCKGDRWWLKGENGSGKSTLLSLITGDNPKAYANDLWLFGNKRGSGESIWDIKKNIGFVSPELQWYFDTGMTVSATIGSGFFDTIGLFRKLSKQQEETVQEWLIAFGLAAHQHRLLSQLSTSQQRLAILARAMVKNPPLLILDEPCQGLDDQQRDEFRHIVDLLCEDPNRTLIYVTHYEKELPLCINKSLLLHKQKGTLNAYTPQPLHA